MMDAPRSTAIAALVVRLLELTAVGKLTWNGRDDGYLFLATAKGPVPGRLLFSISQSNARPIDQESARILLDMDGVRDAGDLDISEVPLAAELLAAVKTQAKENVLERAINALRALDGETEKPRRGWLRRLLEALCGSDRETGRGGGYQPKADGNESISRPPQGGNGTAPPPGILPPPKPGKRSG